jgi:hypothetical protein
MSWQKMSHFALAAELHQCWAVSDDMTKLCTALLHLPPCRADILYHSVTAMVGAGVLGLPATFAHLGWAGGLLFLAFSFWVR